MQNVSQTQGSAPAGHAYAPPTLLLFLYGRSPDTARGKQLKTLWHSCAIEVGLGYVPTDAPLKPLPDDPRVAAMQALMAALVFLLDSLGEVALLY